MKFGTFLLMQSPSARSSEDIYGRGVQRAVYVTDDRADARAAAEEARWNMRVTLSLRHHRERVEAGRAIAVPGDNEPDTDDLLGRFLVIGTETCIRQIARIRELAGISYFNCSFWFGDLGTRACCARWSSLRER
jgi:alkanesulfonate monooxygenase SsuD/methylene tetrahydromethanopterin reductase-like flavin-dependent oxidoreductase (luciferase family)